MVHVGVRYHTYISRKPYDDGWDRGDTSGSIDGVFISERDYDRSYSGMDTDLEPPFYVVYASYTTGDTFGNDFAACVVGVVKEESEAIALSDEARDFSGFGSLSNGFYVPWNGYFESLISVAYERLA